MLNWALNYGLNIGKLVMFKVQVNNVVEIQKEYLIVCLLQEQFFRLLKIVDNFIAFTLARVDNRRENYFKR